MGLGRVGEHIYRPCDGCRVLPAMDAVFWNMGRTYPGLRARKSAKKVRNLMARQKSGGGAVATEKDMWRQEQHMCAYLVDGHRASTDGPCSLAGDMGHAAHGVSTTRDRDRHIQSID